MILVQEEIDYAANKIACIDSGEKGIFLENVNTENQYDVKVFYNTKMSGVFFSCIFYDSLRIHIVFEEDTDKFNGEIASFVESSMEKSNLASVMIWLRNENRKIIEYLKNKFHTKPEGAYYYASAEYIMRRVNFNITNINNILEIRPYEEKYIDKYLLLLDESMTFVNPPPNFCNNKDHFLRHFAERRDKNSFEAFWIADELVGLYWRKNQEIDIMAVATNYQRKGYGSIILTRAIEMALKNTDAEYIYLYAVDWNEKGQAFYKKYGMELNGHSYLLRITNPTV